MGDKGTPPIGQDFGGHDRFQGNFRMLSQMRTCMQLVSANEARAPLRARVA